MVFIAKDFPVARDVARIRTTACTSAIASSTAATSPRPNASYTSLMILMLTSALMGSPSTSGPPRHRRGAVLHGGYVAGLSDG